MTSDEYVLPSDSDVTSQQDGLSESDVEYFSEKRPQSFKITSPQTLLEMVSEDSSIEFQRYLHDDLSTDSPRRISATRKRRYVSKYAYSVPTEEVLEYIAEHDPVVELFAGQGYWSYELSKHGCEVEAYDADPSHDDWGDVERGTQDALLMHGESQTELSLLLCWPPIGPAAYESVLVARPENIFFVGERPCDGMKAMADADFFKNLDARYECIKQLELPSIKNHQDNFYHYRRQ